MLNKKKFKQSINEILASEAEADAKTLKSGNQPADSTAAVTASKAAKTELDRFESLHKEAEAAFSVKSLTEKAGSRKFAEAFNKLLSFREPYKEKEAERVIKRLQRVSGDPYSKKSEKHPYLIFGQVLAKLYDNSRDIYFMFKHLEKLTRYHINVNLFFALPSVIERLEHKSYLDNADCTAILALLSIYKYGMPFDKAKLYKLADRFDYISKNGRNASYYMKMTSPRLRDIADGLYDGIFNDIQKFRALAVSAENAGQTGDAAGYYFEAAKLADFPSVRDYLRLSTDLNRDIADVGYKSHDDKLFLKCQKSALKKNDISSQIAALQPALDIYHPYAYFIASECYKKAGDEENAALMREKAIGLADSHAIGSVFDFKNAEMFAADTDRYMRFAFLLLANVARREGKLVEGFNISLDQYELDAFYKMLTGLCTTNDFFDENENEKKVPQLDDRQKRIVFAWVFRGSFDIRFDRFDQNALANLFNVGFGTPVNKPAAIAIWSDETTNNRIGDSGDKEERAAYYLGRAYLLGDGVERNREKAVEYLNKAATYGECSKLANKLLELNDKTPTGLSNEGVKLYRNGDYEKALGYFEEAALLGSAPGCRNAGVCYYYGRGTEKNIKKAYEYFRMGADGDIECAFYAGNECERNGDCTSAKVYYERASAMEDGGDSHFDGKAALRLAQLYYNGTLTGTGTGKKDTLRYLFWMKKAIASGVTVPEENKKQFANTSATSHEILTAFNTVMIKQLSDEYSVFVLQRAVGANILGAQEELGVLYYTGRGVAADKDKAFYLLTSATAGPHRDRCEYYLACWYADKATEFYLDYDIKGFNDSIRKADDLICEVTQTIDIENKCDLIDALLEFADYMIAFNAYTDNECDEDEVEERFKKTCALLVSLDDEYNEIAISALFDIYMLSCNGCDYLDEDEIRQRLKIAYRYLYNGVSAGIKSSERMLASMTEDHFITGSLIFDTDEPEVALFYLNQINETNIDAMRKTGGIYKLVYNDYQKALYYFDKALRAGSDDKGVFAEIGLMLFDDNGNYRPGKYGISKAQQEAYLRMSAANGCEEAQRVLSMLTEYNLI